jgi:parallel beta-helix repeat protein
MFAHSPWSRRIFTFVVMVFCTAAICFSSTVEIHPGQDIPSVVAQYPAGTTFVIYPGTYRLQEHILAKTGDTFIGQTACAPPKTLCPVILTGSKIIGPLAKFNGTNYEVTGQTQEGVVSLPPEHTCEPGYYACNRPEDLFFDGTPYQHLDASSLPPIGAKQWWFDYANHIIYFHDNPNGHTVETSVLDTAFDSNANNVTIQYLTIEGFANPLQRAGIQPSSGTVTPGSSANWVIRNCDLYNNHAAGVRAAYGLQVYNSYVHNNGTLGIGGGTDSMAPSGIVIQGSTVNNNNYAHMLSGSGAGGIKFGYSANVVVRGNTVSNNSGTGIHFDTSSTNPLIDGNIVTDNSGGAGIAYEISLNSATVRNNVLLRNNIPNDVPVSTASAGSYASTGVKIYCNVIEVPNVNGQGNANGMTIGASNRGYNTYPPYQYLTSTGNAFHHNTVIWDAGAKGNVGYFQHDVANQPNFFANNSVPDYNTYHLPSLSSRTFIYDNNNSGENRLKTFSEYQASGADIHGSADTQYLSGYPTVAITSPADQSAVTNSVTVEAAASDKSGINRVEFYVDWKLQATVTGSPYSFTWNNGTTGTHIVAAMAHANSGVNACYAVTLTKK